MGEAPIPLSFTDWERTFDDMPAVVLKNRFFEQNPSQVKGVALIAKPGTDRVAAYGDGPIRGFYSLPGLHDGAVFFVSDDTLYRRQPDGSGVTINGVIYGTGSVSMTGVKGPGYEYLFIADGSHLQVYTGGTSATATLTGTGNVSEGDTLQINSTYYRWTATVGTGAGTLADPWDVLIGATLADSLQAMVDAISFVGTPGVNWSSNLGGQNSDVTAAPVDTAGTSFTITARTDLAVANSYVTAVTSSDTVPNIAWGSGTMTGGGTHGLTGVEMPDGLPPLYLTTLKGFILIAVAGSDRFYYLRPGELEIDGLSFYTAEAKPDELVAVEGVGDTAWLIGVSSCEVWYATGDIDSPFAPVQGRTYPFGAIPGTIVNIKDTILLVGQDNVVYAMAGGSQRVSNHGIEEMIRLTLESE